MAENAGAPVVKKEAKPAALPAAQVAAAKPTVAEKKAEPAKAQGSQPQAAEGAKKEEAPKEAKKREIVLERVYNVPLVEAYKKPHYKRADFATDLLRSFLAKHFKAELSKVKLSPALSASVRVRGSQRPLKLVKVRATKDKEGKVLAEPAQ